MHVHVHVHVYVYVHVHVYAHAYVRARMYKVVNEDHLEDGVDATLTDALPEGRRRVMCSRPLDERLAFYETLYEHVA